MAVRLRMVAEASLRLRVVLLGQQPGRPRAVQHLREQLLGVGPAPGAQVGLDQPGRADVESAFASGQAVVPLVAVDGRAAAQLRFDLERGGEEARDGQPTNKLKLRKNSVPTLFICLPGCDC